MKIRATFTMNEFRDEVERRLQAIHQQMVRRLSFLGEQCLTEARSNHTYTDQTGNLTSSMGYVILLDGHRISYSGFSGGQEGANAGEQVLSKVSSKYGKGYALIVVAGMNYAAHVEARGYNVLTSAEMLAERELPKMLRALQRNIKKMD